MRQQAGIQIHITGVVQGVGFRPFVYSLAQRLKLTGWVRNTTAGVDIWAGGTSAALTAFQAALRDEAPPLARIEHLEAVERFGNGCTSFSILPSLSIGDASLPVSPDISICPDCLAEMRDPANRRYRYPFINCTNCGPRFTIIQALPYDRPLTTMSGFNMCEACRREYLDPADRRFHAQPIACAACGPSIWLEEVGDGLQPKGNEAIRAARRRLREGGIVAIKGLGGFHLACDASDDAAAGELRRRKLRVDKPFAVMMLDAAIVAQHCHLEPAELNLLQSSERPIVLLRKRAESTIAAGVAPGQSTLGVMLPYTPLHYLLLEPEPGFPEALVMTSGNISEEPIAFSNEAARRHLPHLADAFLLHDRPIHSRCDDSVVRVAPLSPGQLPKSSGSNRSRFLPLRRARGYAPFPVKLPWPVIPLLATGAELKNTFCLTRHDHAFISHHIGDMENYETLCSFEESIAHYQDLFRIQPEAIAHDLHPDYLSSRCAVQRSERDSLPAIAVQHHHAHIAACMVEHGLPGDQPLIGVSFDGTGCGDDGAVWGGEFLIADYAGYQRAAHLAYIPMPGGDKAVKEPWRLALAWLDKTGLACSEELPLFRADQISPLQRQVAAHQIRTGLNAPLTSSMGRLFDAAAALLGVRMIVNYEAQAAIELEAAVDTSVTGSYPFDCQQPQVDPSPLFAAIVDDLRRRVSVNTIAARFHNSIAQMVLQKCRQLREESGINQVALSGGVWQNMVLLSGVTTRLRQAGFIVYTHHLVPTNDGGLSLGQAAIAAHRLGISDPT